MRALTVVPGRAGSLELTEVPDLEPAHDELLVQGLTLGVCGTDKEIAAGEYGSAKPGQERLVLGHESLGKVVQAPRDSRFGAGDLVAGMVRRPDPLPCPACAHGDMDMCRNGEYTERGIKSLDGFGSERWTVLEDYAVHVAPSLASVGALVEPMSVVVKAWDEIERVGSRSWFEPRSVLVTGAGAIGLLAALLGVQRGLDVHVLDQVSSGPKPRLVKALGATYHSSGIADVGERVRPDVVIEATGVGQLVVDAMSLTAPYGIVCLVGLSSGGRGIDLDASGLNRSIVLENDVVLGSVSANRRHYLTAVEALERADLDWLSGVVSRRVPLTAFQDAFDAQPDDVKVMLTLTEG